MFYLEKFLLVLFLVINVTSGGFYANGDTLAKRVRIMGLGDSITEGGDKFHSYMFPLWEKLYSAGYDTEFIGPRESKCRIENIPCAGYSGKNAEYLDSVIDSVYRIYPADIVLLHSGHNHFESEHPVAGIIAAQKSIIQKIKAINPDVKILVAQVILSGKLPKYSYLQELNLEISEMVEQLNDSNVILVNQAEAFDWHFNTIDDMVHPNPQGAEIMANVWFRELRRILPVSQRKYEPLKIVYKELEDGVELKLHIFLPDKRPDNSSRPALVYFFGGGWTYGTPLQFYRECSYYADRGIVAITAEYRIASVHHSTPVESVNDARCAIRWLRQNASTFNIDTARIAAAGASAGGHLAAMAGLHGNIPMAGFSSKPNLLLLYYPVIDYTPVIRQIAGSDSCFQTVSPMAHISKACPPCLYVVGDKDSVTPLKTAEEFARRMKDAGVEFELDIIKAAGHPIFYYRKPLTKEFFTIQSLTDKFLANHGYFN